MNSINVLIIDDEEESREGIKKLLNEDEQIVIKELCKNGLAAIQSIHKYKPDLIFLDIQMPEINGFEVLNSIAPGYFPVVIFITAYDNYAIQAFEHQAIDYILKPFTKQRFNKALSLAKKLLLKNTIKESEIKVNNLIQQYPFNEEPEPLISGKNGIHSLRLIIKSKGKIYFLKYEDVIWIEAQDIYVKIHTKKQHYLIRESMKRMESRLPKNQFVRIHKSSIVNLNAIQELEPFFNSEYIMKLFNGQTLKVSRSYTQNIKKLL